MQPSWSPQQAKALESVNDWWHSGINRRQIFRVFGYAGTGKTTLAKYFARNLAVAFCAYTGKAAMVMRKNGCAGALTIHASIYNVEIDPATGVRRWLLKDVDDYRDVDLFVIDECSMVDDEIGKHVLSFGIPVLVLGDPAQLPPVKGGGFFTNADPDVMLTEIHRQARDNPIIDLATRVREGLLLKYGRYGDSAAIIQRANLKQKTVMAADQIIVGLNKTRDTFNHRVRSIRGFKNEFPEVGETLVCLRNDRELGIFNGGLWKVLELPPRKPGGIKSARCVDMHLGSLDFEHSTPVEVRVRKEFFQGKGAEIPWKELRGTQEFDFGYALTCHKSQGSQWPFVCVFDEGGAFGPDYERWLYTAITRASEKLIIVR
jgi:exodeoxyribonuclease-5